MFTPAQQGIVVEAQAALDVHRVRGEAPLWGIGAAAASCGLMILLILLLRTVAGLNAGGTAVLSAAAATAAGLALFGYIAWRYQQRRTHFEQALRQQVLKSNKSFFDQLDADVSHLIRQDS